MIDGAARTDGSSGRRLLPGRGTTRSLAGQSILIAAVCLVTDVVSFTVRGHDTASAFATAVLIALVAADAALASAPRRSGWVVLAHAALLPALAVVLPGRSASPAGQLVAAYRAGAWLRGWPAAASVITLALGVLFSVLVGGVGDTFVALTLVTANSVLPWLVGRYTTARKAHVDELRRQREESLRDAEAEVSRAVGREREAIAHELHDVISHHVSAIGVHAAAARMNLTGHATAAGPVTTSLAAVEASSRAAMLDLGRLLDLLHAGDGSAGQPGLAELEELFDGVRSSGLDVAFVVYDDPCRVPSAVSTTLYRMTQEMMTNALRHGDGTAVRVELECADDRVRVTARNRIPAGSALAAGPVAGQGLGRGLGGIGRRAEILGGRAAFGPVEDGRYWETSVSLPIGGRA